MSSLMRFVSSTLALEIAYEALMDAATSEEHVDLACEVLDALQLPPPDHSDTRSLQRSIGAPKEVFEKVARAIDEIADEGASRQM
ncbi:hypothetical protein PRIPAC_97538 [Pristionchus pacificus]|uniref:Uncharacterized protein n=1 Tax=Pristionchus pacificus TaxID=54126 RepID=A0A454Y477_PRIPA|nr:hypothetical protein PRIPAC_97538 [Pristionchus pacificus]|eukprot:PDM80526.1 hypothetical protein PRIPAC_35429 [Pristionchus pacificus]